MSAQKGRVLFVLTILCLILVAGGLPRPGLAQSPQESPPPPGCWQVVPTPAINSLSTGIVGVSATSSNDVWVLGTSAYDYYNSDVPFVEHWDGIQWNIVPTPIVTETDRLTAIKVIAKDDVWVIGTRSHGSDANLLALHWNGNGWTATPNLLQGAFPFPYLDSIDASSSNDVWVTFTYSGGGQDDFRAAIYHWDGKVWQQSILPDADNNMQLNDIVALSDSNVWAVGSDILHWNGATWTSFTTANAVTLNAIAAISANDMWAVGSSNGQQIGMHWDGHDWTTTTIRSPGDGGSLLDVAALSPDNVWAVGSYAGQNMWMRSGTWMVHWDGNRWTNIPDPVASFFSNVNHIEAIGDEFLAGGDRVVRPNNFSDAVLMRYASQPCSASAPQKPLNMPVPLPGEGSQQFITGYSASGIFLQYWQTHGGLLQQGYPISGVFGEQSDLNGHIYTVQYFERGVFEYHPELIGTPYEVLLAQLGTFQYQQKYPNGAPNQRANQDPGTIYFPQTGKHLGGTFLQYWQEHGGLQQQGYPISEEFTEVSDLDGRPYTVQYFERAVFEWHPENPAPYNVLLSQLGHFRYETKYGSGQGQTVVPRQIAASILPTTLQGAGNELIWNDMRDNGYNSQIVYSYDATQNRELPISQPLVTSPVIFSLGTNGELAFWTRDDTDEKYLEGYDFRTGGQIKLYQPDTVPNPDFRTSQIALDQTTLYYADHSNTHLGIFAHDLATSHERQISDDTPIFDSLLTNPVAADGSILWADETPGAGHSLNLYRSDAGSVTPLASGIGGFTGYGVSGNCVVYSFFSNITNQTTYLYNIQTGERKVIALGAASDPVIQGNRVAWVRWPSTDSGESDGWKIETYDIASGATKVVASGLRAMPKNLVLLADGKIAYAADNDLTVPGSELYLLDLDSAP